MYISVFSLSEFSRALLHQHNYIYGLYIIVGKDLSKLCLKSVVLSDHYIGSQKSRPQSIAAKALEQMIRQAAEC